MNAEDFKIAWNKLDLGKEISSPLISYTSEELSSKNLSASTKEFLTISGIPKSAPPFLNFGFKPLVSLKDEFTLENKCYSNYLVIGSTDGMEFCIDCNNHDQIVLFDRYEVLSYDRYEGEGAKPYPVNASINQLAESLLLVRKNYHLVVEEKEKIKDAFIFEEKRPILRQLREDLKAIDPVSFNNDGFWDSHLI